MAQSSKNSRGAGNLSGKCSSGFGYTSEELLLASLAKDTSDENQNRRLKVERIALLLIHLPRHPISISMRLNNSRQPLGIPAPHAYRDR